MDENFEYESNEEIDSSLEEAEFEEDVPEKKVSLGKEIFEWCYTIAIALIIAIVVKAFVFDVVQVDGPSMLPTLHDNDRLIVTKLGYKPKQGDIIILDSTREKRQTYIDKVEESNGHKLTLTENIKLKLSMPKSLKTKYYVKRVIALPGQTVDIIDGNVYVDGSKLEEPYFDGFTQRLDSGVSYPVTVKENHVFVMGDNRGNSTDSRSSTLGQVPYEAVFGKAQLRFWPLNSINILK